MIALIKEAVMVIILLWLVQVIVGRAVFGNSNSMPFYHIRFLNNIAGRYSSGGGIRSYDGYKEKRPTCINRCNETHAYVRVVNN